MVATSVWHRMRITIRREGWYWGGRTWQMIMAKRVQRRYKAKDLLKQRKTEAYRSRTLKVRDRLWMKRQNMIDRAEWSQKRFRRR